VNPTSPPPSSASLPLSRLLAHTADAVRAVRAGQSLTDALAACPAEARAGTQALSFQVMRSLGRARALRQQLARRDPPPWVDALLLSALALVWDAQAAPYAEHTLVDQAVEAAKQRERAHVAFVNAVLRRFLREREALVQRTDADPVARWNHPSWWLRRLRRDWPQHWQALCEAIDLGPIASDPRFATNAGRVERIDEVMEAVERAVARYPTAELLARLDAAGVPCGPVKRVEDLFFDEHVLENGIIVELDHPTAGPMWTLGVPFHLSGTPLTIRRPAPLLGQHTDEVLRELGYAPAEIASLRADGALGPQPSAPVAD